jgi:hypothetical protein
VMDPEWALCLEGEVLVAHAGADRRFEVQDCSAASARQLILAAAEGEFAPSELSAEASRAVQQLVILGALRPAIVSPSNALVVGLRFAGSAVPGLSEAISAAVDPQRVRLASDDEAVRLWVLVRTNVTLEEAVTMAPQRDPYLCVDAAYHHTISLGPLVIPGQTACLACLSGRIAHRWGDPAPPTAPKATRRSGLLAGWIAAELENIGAGASTLANRTISMDISSHRMTDHSLLRLPDCASCGSTPGRGRIDLPWEAGA